MLGPFDPRSSHVRHRCGSSSNRPSSASRPFFWLYRPYWAHARRKLAARSGTCSSSRLIIGADRSYTDIYKLPPLPGTGIWRLWSLPRRTMLRMPSCLGGVQYVFRAGCKSPPAVGCESNEPASVRQSAMAAGVSRSGPSPEPTVIVRMREDVPAYAPLSRAPQACVTFAHTVFALKRFSPTYLARAFQCPSFKTPSPPRRPLRP